MSTATTNPDSRTARFETTTAVPEGTARAMVDQLLRRGLVRFDRTGPALIHEPTGERFRANEAMTLYQLGWEHGQQADDPLQPAHLCFDPPTVPAEIHVGPVTRDGAIVGYVAIEGIDGTPQDVIAPTTTAGDRPIPVPFSRAVAAATDRVFELAGESVRD